MNETLITKRHCFIGMARILATTGMVAWLILGWGSTAEPAGRVLAHEVHKAPLLLQSAGHHSGISRAQHLIGQGEVRLRRGVTLLGLLAAGPAVKLAHVDTCDPSNPSGDDVLPVTRFKTLMAHAEDAFSDYAIVVHDSAFCGDRAALRGVLQDLDLLAGPSLELRQPYIAVLARGEIAQEFSTVPSTLLSVMVDVGELGEPAVAQRRKETLPRVAHAGGGIDGRTYTNSLDALDHNRSDFSLFEVDLSWTSDDKLVCLHDWDYHFEQIFGLEPEGAVSLERFKALVATHSSLQQCTLASLAEWLRHHPDARIVTDIKQRNGDGLARIAEHYPDLQERFVPQVYRPGEYFMARRLGFDDVIWTLYRYPGSDDEVLAVLDTMDLYGLTMTQAHAERGLARRARERRGVLSWAHTLNTREELDNFRALGVTEIYTDWLVEAQ